MVEQEPQAEAVGLLVLLRAMLCMIVRVASSTPQNRDDSALHALRRLSTIASALGHQKEQIPDDVSTRGDVDACSRALGRKPYSLTANSKVHLPTYLGPYPSLRLSEDAMRLLGWTRPLTPG